MAEQEQLEFYLINLVREWQEEDIEKLFKKHIKETDDHKFLRLTWENIYQYTSTKNDTKDKDIIKGFFKNKTIGYDKEGKLQSAFKI